MRVVTVLIGAVLFGCAGEALQVEPDLVDAGQPDADVSRDIPDGFDAETWEKLLTLAPPELPAPPADASNMFADDPQAAELGQKLFFDTGFSGPLLESDNDGQHNGVGFQGEAQKVSCASCHVAEDGFVDTRTVHKQISLASGWTGRRTPGILDVGHAKLLMWDGRFDSLQRQVLAVFESPMEGNSSRLFVAQEIARRYADEYQDIFGDDPRDVLGDGYPILEASRSGCLLELTSTTTPDEACSEGELHGVPGDGAEYDSLSPAQQERVTRIAMNMGKAIAAYERLLSCGQSRFDDFMHGNERALTAQEKRGAALFAGKGKCVDCHSGPFMSDQEFHNVGVQPVPVAVAFLNDNDEGASKGLQQALADPLNTEGSFSDGRDGRLPEAPTVEHLGAFRTPMLRCVADRPSFMHTAQLGSLEEVVSFFNQGGHVPAGEEGHGFLGSSVIEPLALSEPEERDLVAFLRSLDSIEPVSEALLRNPHEELETK